LLRKVQDIIFRSQQFQQLLEHISLLKEGNTLVVHNAAGSLISFAIAKIFLGYPTHILVVASDQVKAQQIFDDCSLLSGKENVLLFSEMLRYHDSVLLDATENHIELLRRLQQQTPLILIIHPRALATKLPSPNSVLQNNIELNINEEFTFETLTSKLQQWNFEKVDFVTASGEYSVRGGIVDVFSYAAAAPMRVEFFGDEIVSMREFDVLSQRSIKEMKSVILMPNVLQTSTEQSLFTSAVFDYLQTSSILVFDEPTLIQKEIEEQYSANERDFFSWNELKENFVYFPNVHVPQFHSSQSERSINFHSMAQPSFNGSLKELIRNLREKTQESYKIFLASSSTQEKKRLEELLRIGDEENIESTNKQTVSELSNVEFLGESIHAGFDIPSATLVLYTEHEIFGRRKRNERISRMKFRGMLPRELLQLQRGDFVTHIDYGVGKFAGLQKISTSGGTQEVAKILYRDDDALYVNINYLSRIQKYSSKDGHTPTLTKLGGREWENVKTRAKKRINDIARELMQLYAKRTMKQGFAFSSDTTWQNEMEASFIYEDTHDQLRATVEIKKDMESSVPMDRLICGDVGFGKTEVAIRAAFKAVMDKKQVAVLVPTTILALQHSRTFNDRLQKYAVRVENITRFKTAKEQKKILEDVQEGKIDVLIGTHRLLSDDVEFRDVGLLIIDEEHRFGVSAKEKLRQRKEHVDTLTLTATPIPRTLQFSLLGVRDLSLLETPPKNRLPIITSICQFDRAIIRDAIVHELHRGGQIYFVNDHVNDMETIIARLREYVPEARFGIAHGQMEGHELEKTMINFWEKKFDVLVCTKIIESGLDIPNVNTIIINRAHHFGMAELYQIRGRVGRSNIQAYAYLLTPPLSLLPKTTLRRLQSLHEFTELGSGFHLAMRDFEIRGAGNMLGAEQSGFINEMGFEMYQQIVQETVSELQQAEFRNVFHTKTQLSEKRKDVIIETDMETVIPKHYMESDAERFDVYRRLAVAQNESALRAIREELLDRFGSFPSEVQNLFELIELRLAAAAIGLTKIDLRNGTLVLEFPEQRDSDFYDGEIFQTILRTASRNSTVKFYEAEKKLRLETSVKFSEDNAQRILYARNFVSSLIKE
jgi:transcription-repair coupling factor (superfamily II helicase)